MPIFLQIFSHRPFKAPWAAVLLLICLVCHPAMAEISWMKGAKDCKTFGPALKAYLDKIDLNQYQKLPFWQREELSIVLTRACRSDLESCGFESCKRWSSLVTVQDSESDYAWLDRFLSCEQLIEQIQGRYASLSPSEIALPETKKELAHVLEISCSPRFEHCKFQSCASVSKNSSEEKNTVAINTAGGRSTRTLDGVETVVDARVERLAELAQKRLATLVANYSALQAAKIRAASNEERSQNKRWKRMVNNYESKVISDRREKIREEKRSVLEDDEKDSKRYDKYGNIIRTRRRGSSRRR